MVAPRPVREARFSGAAVLQPRKLPTEAPVTRCVGPIASMRPPFFNRGNADFTGLYIYGKWGFNEAAVLQPRK